MSSKSVPFNCECGTIKGEIIDSNRFPVESETCYCDGCTAFVSFCKDLEVSKTSYFTENNGVEQYCMYKCQFKINEGQDMLGRAKFVANDAKVIRFFAKCCGTPIVGVFKPSMRRFPLIWVSKSVVDHAGKANMLNLKHSTVRHGFGPNIAKFDEDGKPRRASAGVASLMGFVGHAVGGIVRRRYSPFFMDKLPPFEGSMHIVPNERAQHPDSK